MGTAPTPSFSGPPIPRVELVPPNDLLDGLVHVGLFAEHVPPQVEVDEAGVASEGLYDLEAVFLRDVVGARFLRGVVCIGEREGIRGRDCAFYFQARVVQGIVEF